MLSIHKCLPLLQKCKKKCKFKLTLWNYKCKFYFNVLSQIEIFIMCTILYEYDNESGHIYAKPSKL